MILVAGAGFLGESILAGLARDRIACCGITLSQDRADTLTANLGVPVLATDLADRDLLGQALEKFPEAPTHVVHCASSNRGGPKAYQRVFVDGTRHLLELIQPKRLLFSSSTSVYRQTDGSRVDENSPAEPTSATGRLLIEGEGVALESGQHAVLRLAGLYGPGRSFVLQRFLEGKATIDHPPEGGRWLNQIHREDAASAIRHLLDRQETGVFNIVDSRSIRQSEVYEVLSQRFDQELPPTSAPNLEGKRGWTHKEVVSTRLPDLGWTPRYSDWIQALEGDPELLPSILKRMEESS